MLWHLSHTGVWEAAGLRKGTPEEKPGRGWRAHKGRNRKGDRTEEAFWGEGAWFISVRQQRSGPGIWGNQRSGWCWPGRLYIVGLPQGHPTRAPPRNHVLVGADWSEKLTASTSRQETPKPHVTLAFRVSSLRWLVPPTPTVMIIFLPNSPCQGGASLRLALPSHRAWHQAKPNLCVSEQTAADGALRSAVTSHSPPQNIISVCLKVHH